MNIPVAVQLYTLREETEIDFVGTLKKVAEIGYKGVEFAGFGGFKASELKAILLNLGLKPAGAHIGIEELSNNLNEIIAYNLELGNRYIVCPYANFENKEAYINMAAELDKIGKKLKSVGLELCYHNHAHEFTSYDGEYGLDIIYKGTEAENLKAEVDTYWVAYAGLDPAEYLKKYALRTPLVHIKDMENSENRDFTEIGNGILDIKAIAKQAIENEAEWLIVEQDVCKRPTLESVKISFESLKKMELV